MIIDFKIQNQTLQLTSKNRIVADSVNYLKCEFEFSDEWIDPKHAIFYSEKEEMAVLITAGDDGKYFCYVPSEVINFPFFRISVYCTTNDMRITTNMLTIEVEKSGYGKAKILSQEDSAVYGIIYTPLEENKRVSFLRQNDGRIELSEDGGNWSTTNANFGGNDINVKDGVDGKDGYTPIKGVDYFDGTNGKDGKDGKDGVNGSDGSDGFSPKITVTENTDEVYKLNIKTADDEFSTPNLKGRAVQNSNILHNWDFRNPVNQRSVSGMIV